MFWIAGILGLIIGLWFFFYILWRVKFRRLDSGKIPTLAFHQVSDSFSWSITRQRVNQFERSIRYLREEGYKSASVTEITNANHDKDDKKVILTFDDGYEDFYRNAFPFLKRYDFTACVFIITGYVGEKSNWDYNWGRYKRRHLSWPQIIEISKAGFEIGSHTVNHPDLTKIPASYLTHELKVSKQTLEDKLNRRVDILSYPFGRYNRQVQDEAERSGYKGAFGLSLNLKKNKFDSFSIPRKGVYLLDSPLTLDLKLNQGRLSWVEEMKGWIINRFPGWTIMLKGLPDYGKMKPVPEKES
jgi:peptidoglycan/xylan/chitin deacetylase (PgdA/CDA1 family)